MGIDITHSAKLNNGEIVGEMALFENSARSASAKAIVDSSVICFDLEKIKYKKNKILIRTT